MPEALMAKTSKGKGTEQVQKHPAEVAHQPVPTSPGGAVLALQRKAGNHAVNQSLGQGLRTMPSTSGLLQRKCACGNNTMGGGECEECGKKQRLGLQTKLKVNEPGDIYEQEADRIADHVMATPAHQAVSGAPLRIQRFSGQSNVQMGAAPASVDQVLSGPGRPLEPTLRQDMEQRFGHDFSRVRVHSDAAAEQSARDVNAQAYTVGPDIVFGSDRFAPGTHEGQRLIAHELTHVVQQSGADGRSVGPNNERRVPSAVPRVSPISRGGGASAPVVQCKQQESTEATASEAMWHQVVGEHSTAVGKMARVRAPLGVRLRLRPTPGAPNEVILPFDELVRVERKTDYGWCWVVSMGKFIGKTGFCEEQYLSIDPPEPTAHLYQVQPGDTLGAIATRYYGKSMDEENNARLYVQALYIANKGHAGVYLDEVDLSLSETLLRSGREEETLKIYKGAKVRKGLAIWVPSEDFIQQLKTQGLITSGSTEVMKVWRRAKKFVKDVYEGVKYVAGFIVGLLEGAWDAIVDLFKGAVDMIEAVAKALYHLITGNPGAIKDVLMGWVEKLKLAWKNRGQIASDFMEKWEAEDGWDRGRFQGKVLGWVMMTALIVIVTAGQAAIAQIAGKWKFVIDVLKLADRAGDIGTYVRAAGKLPGKAAELVRRQLGRKTEQVAGEVAEKPAKEAVEKVGTKAAKELVPEALSGCRRGSLFCGIGDLVHLPGFGKHLSRRPHLKYVGPLRRDVDLTLSPSLRRQIRIPGGNDAYIRYLEQVPYKQWPEPFLLEMSRIEKLPLASTGIDFRIIQVRGRNRRWPHDSTGRPWTIHHEPPTDWGGGDTPDFWKPIPQNIHGDIGKWWDHLKKMTLRQFPSNERRSIVSADELRRLGLDFE